MAPRADVKSHTIRGVRWKIKDISEVPDEFLEDNESLDGLCVHSENILYIPKAIHSWYDLEVVIHEQLHAAYPDLDEEPVDTTARDVTRLIRRLTNRNSPQTHIEAL